MVDRMGNRYKLTEQEQKGNDYNGELKSKYATTYSTLDVVAVIVAAKGNGGAMYSSGTFVTPDLLITCAHAFFNGKYYLDIRESKVFRNKGSRKSAFEGPYDIKWVIFPSKLINDQHERAQTDIAYVKLMKPTTVKFGAPIAVLDDNKFRTFPSRTIQGAVPKNLGPYNLEFNGFPSGKEKQPLWTKSGDYVPKSVFQIYKVNPNTFVIGCAQVKDQQNGGVWIQAVK